MASVKYQPNYRDLVVGVNTSIPLKNGRRVYAINFDNAATTPPFKSVIQDIINFAPWYSSIHRGTGYKSQLCSNFYENSRNAVLNFVGADPSYYTAIYVKNTTEAINKLSYRLCKGMKKCVILSSNMEHHSNDLPWRHKYHIDYIEIDKDGRLDLKDLEHKLEKYKGRVKLVTVCGASNVTGYINPINRAAELAHKYNAKILIDGAQLVPHCPVDMGALDSPGHIDFLVFSAHKMYAPFGIGVLVAPKDIFINGSPELTGGGTVKIVTHDVVKWDDPPHKEEAGSPNIMGVVALLSSIKTLTTLGMENIDRYERSLTDYALKKLNAIPDIELYGNTQDSKDRVGIIPFNIKGVPHNVIARALSDEAGIAVRNGCFCAQPYVQRLLNISKEDVEKYIKNPDLLRPGMVRISFGLYNTYSEIDVLAYALRFISQNKDVYIKRYKPS
jgi:cysteine desulfurase/selenocysteine lyase